MKPLSSPKKSSTTKWVHPTVVIKDWGGFRYYPLKKQISVNADFNAPFDMMVAGIVHEINHWAHMNPLTRTELDMVLDAHDLWCDSIDDHPLERAAWWGTGFKRRGVRDNGSL